MSWMAPSGRMPDLDDAADYEFGQIGRLARGLHDGGYAGDQRRRQLLQHAPDREVKGVDVDRDAFERGAGCAGRRRNCPSTAALRRRRSERRVFGSSRRAFAGVGEQGADAALDVDPAVGTGGTGGEAFGVELLLERSSDAGREPSASRRARGRTAFRSFGPTTSRP